MEDDHLIELPPWARRKKADTATNEDRTGGSLAERLRRSRLPGDDTVVDLAELERTLERLRTTSPGDRKRRR